jgi:drug/metabolite transporter (DMT)-like permease
MHLEHKGLLYAVAAAVAVSISAVFIKLTVGVPLETLIFFRFFIAILLILPSIIHEKVYIHFTLVPKHFVRALLGLLSICFYFYSVKLLTLVNAVTLTNTTPLFMPLVIFFWLKLIIPRIRIVALIIGFIGVMIILRPMQSSYGWANFIGLAGALASAFALVGVRQLSKTESTITIMTYYFLISTVILFIPMVLAWKPIENPINWLYLLLIGVFSTIYQFCLTKSLTYSPVTKVGSLTYLGVLFSGLLGWWIFDEVPSYWTVIGTALIIFGGVIAILSKDSARKRTP